MTAYQLEFMRHVAVEGDGWRSKRREVCAACGRKVIPFARTFPVPDDGVESVHASVLEWTDDPLLYVAGLMLARDDLADALSRSDLKGFSFRETAVTMLDDAPATALPRYRWMVVEGRCNIADLWQRIVGTCPGCDTPKTEQFRSTQRVVRLRSPLEPGDDVCRGREDAAGIIVSEAFRAFCAGRFPAGIVTFVPVRLEGQA